MSATPTITILPPGIARGAVVTPRIHSNARAQHNKYGRFTRTKRRDDARPGDVLAVMGKTLFPDETNGFKAEAV